MLGLRPMQSALPTLEQTQRSSAITRVEARELTKLFGPTPALRGASLTLNSGPITLLSGKNGAGKSTLLNILGTMLRPSRGSVRYLTGEGKNLDRQAVRAELGWVSHASHCYGELSGRQNISLFAELQGIDPGAYERVAERVGLGAFAERPVSTLSRGQTQRVALGRALVHEPSLLLLDEPWTGLDIGSARMLDDIVLEEQKRGTVVVVVSHDADIQERLCAREVRVIAGRCEEV
jgi:ABC-type multidrug transport system ATPase subunit